MAVAMAVAVAVAVRVAELGMRMGGGKVLHEAHGRRLRRGVITTARNVWSITM